MVGTQGAPDWLLLGRLQRRAWAREAAILNLIIARCHARSIARYRTQFARRYHGLQWLDHWSGADRRTIFTGQWIGAALCCLDADCSADLNWLTLSTPMKRANYIRRRRPNAFAPTIGVRSRL